MSLAHFVVVGVSSTNSWRVLFAIKVWLSWDVSTLQLCIWSQRYEEQRVGGDCPQHGCNAGLSVKLQNVHITIQVHF